MDKRACDKSYFIHRISFFLFLMRFYIAISVMYPNAFFSYKIIMGICNLKVIDIISKSTSYQITLLK